jgi:hypothetical protein
MRVLVILEKAAIPKKHNNTKSLTAKEPARGSLPHHALARLLPTPWDEFFELDQGEIFRFSETG